MAAVREEPWTYRGRHDANRWAALQEVRQLTAFIAGRNHLRVEQLTSKSRKRPLVRLRAAVAWIARQDIMLPVLSDPERSVPVSTTLIAAALGVGDHSTICNIVTHAEIYRERDAEYAAMMDHWMAAWRHESPIPPPEPRVPVPAQACRKPKNDLSPDDKDALRRMRASNALVAAIRREHPERFAA